jgi:hypothetical protein
VIEALRGGVPVEGICLYPIVNYPGWDDGRRFQTGLWDYCDGSGYRETYQPLLDEFLAQQEHVESVRKACKVVGAAR